MAANLTLRLPDIERPVLTEVSNPAFADPQRRTRSECPLRERRAIEEIEARRQELSLPITHDAILHDEQDRTARSPGFSAPTAAAPPHDGPSNAPDTRMRRATLPCGWFRSAVRRER